MKPTELRIGNRIDFFAGPPHQRSICRNGFITEIAQDWVCINELRVPDYTALIPVPLTEEWLLKVGFENHNNFYYTNESAFKVEKTITGGFHLRIVMTPFSSWPVTNIDHVHQLQNLYFALTGEDLNTQY